LLRLPHVVRVDEREVHFHLRVVQNLNHLGLAVLLRSSYVERLLVLEAWVDQVLVEELFVSHEALRRVGVSD
jgi:hypothetical protein